MYMVNLHHNFKSIIWLTLQLGLLKERLKTIEKNPQNGIISALICKIALQGIEDLENNKIYKGTTYQRALRYADHMVFFLKPKEAADLLRKKIYMVPEQRGLNVGESKNHLVKSTESFDFLGWHFTVQAKN